MSTERESIAMMCKSSNVERLRHIWDPRYVLFFLSLKQNDKRIFHEGHDAYNSDIIVLGYTVELIILFKKN